MSQKMIMCSLDISAQEPYQVSILSKEHKYLALFRNRIIGAMGLTRHIDEFVGKKFFINPDEYSDKSMLYWLWLSKFHWDFLPLKQFNDRVELYKQTQDENVLSEINNQLGIWFEEINQTFEENLKKETQNND